MHVRLTTRNLHTVSVAECGSSEGHASLQRELSYAIGTAGRHKRYLE